jgi:hypothetical protein
MVQLPSAPVMATVPVGVVPDPLTETVTATAWPGIDGLGVWPVMVVVDVAVAVDTLWLTLLELLAFEPSPLYTAVIVFVPLELKTTLQVPLPPESVMVQLLSAPPMATVPVGADPDPVTETVTATDWPGTDGFGVWAVMVVVVAVELVDTVWLTLVELAAWLPSPLYTAVRVLVPAEAKFTLQLPLPPESVMVQLLPVPVMATVPVGVVPDPLTVAVTATAWPGMDGLGVWAVMLVVVASPEDPETLISAKKVTLPLPTPN